MDILLTFDTTGSMYPCLSEVRRRVVETVERLFKELPNVRIGIIAHGDYCDKNTTYVTKQLPFSTDANDVIDFVKDVSSTHGGDAPECYELVLHEARSFAWESDKRILVMIGDSIPHAQNEAQNYLHLDWMEEVVALHKELNVEIYAVHCLGNRYTEPFYKEIAKYTNGYKVALHQFNNAVEMIMAVFFKQLNKLEEYQQELEEGSLMNRGLAEIFRTLGSTKTVDTKYTVAISGLVPVPPTRFQILTVPYTTDIKSFVESTGATFRKGRGFYEFTKSEMIQERKEVVLQDKLTGDMYTGNEAREMIGLPYGVRGQIRPKFLEGYRVFVQSTSSNRKLIGNTKFLYEAV